MGGFWRRIIDVNLSKNKIKIIEIKKEICRKFLGSKGLSSYYLFNAIKPGIDPFSPENVVCVMTGPLTGTSAPMPNRFSVATKSPLTGIWVDSHCGGIWGPYLKFAGYDGIIIKGASKKPVYLSINNDDVKIKNAEDIWGLDTFESMRCIKDDSETGVPKVLCIGTAAERLARIACTIAEGRAAGRAGTGAVLGSKKLKGIAVYGEKDVPVHNEKEFDNLAKKCNRNLLRSHLKSSHAEEGTAGILMPVQMTGGLPTKNFQSGKSPTKKVAEISGEGFSENLWKKVKGCYRCVIPCSHIAILDGKIVEGPEYETIVLLGSNCGIYDREAIAKADYLCDAYGLDTISTGNTIAFLMECVEKGIINKKDLDGVDLRFGNSESMLKAVKMAGLVSGKLGKLVANGVMRASKKIGKGSRKFAMHVKGLEIPAYVPRAGAGHALAYAISDRGACHLRPWVYGAEQFGNPPPMDPRKYDDKARYVYEEQKKVAVIDSLGICKFCSGVLSLTEDILPLLNALTGFDYDKKEILDVGERINNLVRMFNIREGIGKKDDTLPVRSRIEPYPVGRRKGMVMHVDRMVQEYYEICGWDENGIPKKDKLKNLGLDFSMKHLQVDI